MITEICIFNVYVADDICSQCVQWPRAPTAPRDEKTSLSRDEFAGVGVGDLAGGEGAVASD